MMWYYTPLYFPFAFCDNSAKSAQLGNEQLSELSKIFHIVEVNQNKITRRKLLAKQLVNLEKVISTILLLYRKSEEALLRILPTYQ
ncbi:MAG: hypothetical protein VX294_13855 [Candidatus Latescibacterota bacterium]|nr:hypothetical protein [Candidatus Latescibacterota bacterium]